jgi:hypothetical protein
MTTALLWLPTALAAPVPMPVTGSDARSADLFLTLAKQAQTNGDWGEAAYWYDACLARDRNQPEIKKAFLFCLRNYYRSFRHADPSFRHQVLSPDFKLPNALKFYEEVLAKLQQNYVAPEKANLGRLFREGVVEMRLALEDKTFRTLYVAENRRDRIPSVIEGLKRRLGETSDFANTSAVAREVSRMARDISDVVGIDRRVIVVEFACGACNALDEYTFYASPSALYSGREEKSVFPAVDDYQKYLRDGIGILRITHFQESTPHELEAWIDTFKMQGMQVLILDLRDNRGGSVEMAVDVVRRFLPDGAHIASTTGKVNTPYQSYTMAPLTLPVFVLIDGSTASAAELVAGALKAHKRAELVGQTTHGKNWIQQTVLVSQAPHGAIQITWAQFFLPNTPDLSKGITPTIPVEATPMNNRALDVALERARLLVVLMR